MFFEKNQTFLLLLVTASLWPVSASAYIDPGISLLLYQGAFATIVGVIVALRRPIYTSKKILKSIKRRINERSTRDK